MFAPPTQDELDNGYIPEKIKFLEDYAIRDASKLVHGKKYALLTNGYYLGTYDSFDFVSHKPQGWACGCHETTYNFKKINSDGKMMIGSRSSDFIKEIGVYEVTY
jgi:hypothetical protein